MTRIWIFIFGFWACLLTGVLTDWAGAPTTFFSPGIVQAFKLKNILKQKQSTQAVIEAEIQKLHAESERLEHSRVAIEREVRKQLGYASPDELIFDFAESETVMAGF